MSQRVVNLKYREIDLARRVTTSTAPSLRDFIAAESQDHELEIISYLERAPNYSAMGMVVSDVLDPKCKVALFPGTNTDGVYTWPVELAYYVRKYHLRLPKEFLERMRSMNWEPPAKAAINWGNLDLGLAT